MQKQQSKSRAKNAAQPLGQRHGLVSDNQTEKTAARSRTAAGPDGPDAAQVASATTGKP